MFTIRDAFLAPLLAMPPAMQGNLPGEVRPMPPGTVQPIPPGNQTTQQPGQGSIQIPLPGVIPGPLPIPLPPGGSINIPNPFGGGGNPSINPGPVPGAIQNAIPNIGFTDELRKRITSGGIWAIIVIALLLGFVLLALPTIQSKGEKIAGIAVDAAIPG